MRILIICPHLSTGGQPQVALKRVEALVNTNHEVFLIEYREIAWSYVVQRNKIKELLGDKFISLGWIDKEEGRDHFEEIVKNINPDLIHMEEIPEKFIFGLRQEHSDWLYRKDRSYKIVETTHTMTFDTNQKKYFPDKFLFVSNYSQKEYSKFNIPSSVVEYPIEKLQKNQGQSIKKLNLNSEYFHILNVGLFTRDKNQGYLFDLADKLQEYKIHFHFVGNQAENFQDYWEPLMNKQLDNCFIYGERDDVDTFYQAADLLIHPSILELNPLAIKEATSYNLPVFLKDLPTYDNMYDSYRNVKYLTMDLNDDIRMILNNFNIKRKDDDSSFKKSLILEYESLGIPLIDADYIEYNIDFIDGAKVEILGKDESEFNVEFFDKQTNSLLYNKVIPINSWCATNIRYYKEYKIDIKYKDNLLVSHVFDLKNKNVLIQFDSSAIGDTLAWIPYVEEFRKKHNCIVYCSTFWNKWFINEYLDINFIEPGSTVKNLYAKYIIGWYQPLDSNRNPNDYKKIPLQKTASDILGLDYREIIPKIDTVEGVRPMKDKYVCLAQFSTANSKHWHYPCIDSNKGWQIIVDWLNKQGYKVMVISKQQTKLKNIIDKTGDFPIEHRINEIKHAEFFIGIGSGLSWLAWALGKKVVMISGFSNPICEFRTNNINVHNFNFCNGCFNKHQFDRGAWNWCPEQKNTDRQFECSINITPKMVIDRIVNSKLIENPQEFGLEKYNLKFELTRDKIDLSYEKESNKIVIVYNGLTPTEELCIAIKDFYTNETYHSLSDTVLTRDYSIWSIPGEILHEKTNKLLISFYEKEKLLDIEIDII